MNKLNAKLANDLLFVSPETGKELRPISWPADYDGKFIIVVQDKEGTETWKHTITTEEV